MKADSYFLLFLALTIASETAVWGGTVVLGDGATTNLVVNVPVGSLMVTRASSLSDAANKVSINSSGAIFQPNMDAGFDTRYQPRYLAGPCTFSYSPQFGDFNTSIFNYDLIPAEGIQTLVATNSALIQVPAGKRLRFLDGSYPLTVTVAMTNGASAQFSISPKPDTMLGRVCNTEGFELAGPLSVAVSGDSFGQKPCYVTYFLASDVIQAVGQSIQVPVGSMVAVEKSTDLQTWHPAFIATEKTAPKAFYRLKAVR